MRRPRQPAEMLDMLLLSMLHRTKLSGYDLAQLLKEPIPFIWPVKHSQIYPALAALESRGDIVGDWVPQRGKPDKKAYSLSDVGRERLREWLAQPRPTLAREEAILMAYNYRLIGAAAALAAVSTYRKQAEHEIALIEERWNEILPGLQDGDGPIGPRAAFESGVFLRRAAIGWCDQVTAAIKADDRQGAKA